TAPDCMGKFSIFFISIDLLINPVLLFENADLFTVEWRNRKHLLFPIVVEIRKRSVTGWFINQLFNFPVSVFIFRRRHTENAFIRSNERSHYAIHLGFAVSMIFQHVLFDYLELKRMFFIYLGQIFRKNADL